MDIQSRKISFVQEFLRIKNDEIIDKLENLLHDEKRKAYEKQIKPMSSKEFNDMIDNAEKDAVAGKMKNAKDLKKDIDSWS